MYGKLSHHNAPGGKHSTGPKHYNPKLNLDLGKLDAKYHYHQAQQTPNASNTPGLGHTAVLHKTKGGSAPTTGVDNFPLAQSHQHDSSKHRMTPVDPDSNNPSVHHPGNYEEEAHFTDSQPKAQFGGAKSQSQRANHTAHDKHRAGNTAPTKSVNAKTSLSSPQNIAQSKSNKYQQVVNYNLAQIKKDQIQSKHRGGKTISPALSKTQKKERTTTKPQCNQRVEYSSSPDYDSTARRDSNTMVNNYSEDKQRNAHQNHDYNYNQHGSQDEALHNLFTNFPDIAPEQIRTIQRINIHNINNINTLNQGRDRQLHPSPENQSSQHSEVMRLLNEKDHAIEKLHKDKEDLQQILDTIADELNSAKKAQKLMRDKDEMINRLQDSLNGALLKSQELRHERLSNIQSKSSPGRQKQPSPEDPTELLERKKKSQQEEFEGRRSADKKSSLLELLQKQNNRIQMSKRPEPSYMLSNLEYRTERNSNPVNVVSPSQLYHRNYSTTLEDHIKKKLSESPYYETIKNSKKLSAPKIFGAKKHDSFKPTAKKAGGSNTKSTKFTTNSTQHRRGELADTPRKKLENPRLKNHDKYSRQAHLAPHTTSNAEFELTRRKFSHEPKPTSDSQFTMKLKSRYPHIESSITREEASCHIDIATALTMLKDRIRRVLEKHRDQHIRLKRTNVLILRKLEELGIDLQE